MKAAEVIALLDKTRERLVRNSDEEVGGFVIIVPPIGQAIEFLTFGSHEDTKSFYSAVKDKIVMAAEQDQSMYGGVTLPGMRR
jgi:hypothetical protein